MGEGACFFFLFFFFAEAETTSTSIALGATSANRREKAPRAPPPRGPTDPPDPPDPGPSGTSTRYGFVALRPSVRASAGVTVAFEATKRRPCQCQRKYECRCKCECQCQCLCQRQNVQIIEVRDRPALGDGDSWIVRRARCHIATSAYARTVYLGGGKGEANIRAQTAKRNANIRAQIAHITEQQISGRYA